MHHRARNITGMKLKSLTALEYHGSDGKKSLWKIQCDCGKIIVMPASEFMKQKQSSCGCQRTELIKQSRTTHGMSKHPAFAVWRSMKVRCTLPAHQAWHNYGGRGIRVCERWLESFENFWADMGPSYEKGLSIDRIDNNGDYEPKNCRWVSDKTQSRNKRTNTLISTPWGRMTVSEAAERSGIKANTILYRLNHKCPREFLFSPADATNRFTT